MFEQIEIMDNATGKIRFTLTSGPYESAYTPDDGFGLVLTVSIFHRCDTDPCVVKVWPKTVESFAHKKK